MEKNNYWKLYLISLALLIILGGALIIALAIGTL